MKKAVCKKLTAIILTVLLALSVGVITGCGPKNNADGTIKVWASSDDKPHVEGWLNDFKEANADFGYAIEVAVMGENEASGTLKEDPDVAADVVHIAHDQVGILAEQGFILEIPETHAAIAQVKADNSASLANLGKYNNKYYGIPDIQETYVMYYDKSVFTNANDVKTYEAMKAIIANKSNYNTIGMALKDDGFYSGSFFLSVGAKLYENNVKTECSFNTDRTYEMVKWMQNNYGKNKGFYSGDDIMNGFDSSASTKIGAYIAGPWDAAAVKAKLGNNFAVTKLPTFNMGTGNTNVQLKSLGGVKMYVINSKTTGEKAEAALSVAMYLSSKEVQAKRITARGHFPTHKDLITDTTITSDPLSKALLEQLRFLVPQPTIPAMNDNYYKAGHKKITVLFENKDSAYTPSDKGAKDKLKIGLDELNQALIQ